MSQTVVLNHQEYHASVDIARQFGYTSDYVSRLARKGVVRGIQIKRQWFVDSDSFAAFVETREHDKYERAETLRRERLVERQAQAGELVAEIPAGPTIMPTVSVALAALVVMCLSGVVGLVGWSASQAQLSLAEFSQGAAVIVNQSRDRLVPESFGLGTLVADLQVLTTPPSGDTAAVVRANAVLSTSTSLPVFEAPTSQAGASGTTTSYQFSDPVRVEYLPNGTRIIVPVFRDGQTGPAYRVKVESASTTNQ